MIALFRDIASGNALPGNGQRRSSLERAVELCLSEKCAGFAKDLGRLTQLADLAIQCLDPISLLKAYVVPGPDIDLGLDHPAAQPLPAASDFQGYRSDRSRPIRAAAFLYQNHPDGTFPGFGE